MRVWAEGETRDGRSMSLFRDAEKKGVPCFNQHCDKALRPPLPDKAVRCGSCDLAVFCSVECREVHEADPWQPHRCVPKPVLGEVEGLRELVTIDDFGERVEKLRKLDVMWLDGRVVSDVVTIDNLGGRVERVGI